MTTVYCEFCGEPAAEAENPKAFVLAIKKKYKDVVRCAAHRRTSKLSKNSRSHNPFTGEHRGKRAGYFNLSEEEFLE